MKLYSFEKLDCWQKARELCVFVYRNTSSFPTEEKYGMISQMRRAVVSIASNIAEGSSRLSTKEQQHFSVIAYSSTIELLNDFIIAFDLDIINEEVYIEARNRIEILTLLISQLRKAQLEKSIMPS